MKRNSLAKLFCRVFSELDTLLSNKLATDKPNLNQKYLTPKAPSMANLPLFDANKAGSFGSSTSIPVKSAVN